MKKINFHYYWGGKISNTKSKKKRQTFKNNNLTLWEARDLLKLPKKLKTINVF